VRRWGDVSINAGHGVTGFLHALTVVGVNVVPATGWFFEGWSAGTTLAVYWFENVAACLFVAVRIVVHRRLNPRRGHFGYQAPSADRRGSRRSSFLGGFLVTSLVFCAAHGILLGVILFLLNHHGERSLAGVSWRSVGVGCMIVFAFLVADLGMDLLRVRRWSFRQIEQTANRGLGRIVVVHLTLIFGLFAVALTGASSALFGMFVVLKTMYALALVLPQWEPARPPGWLSHVMNRVPNAHPGERFEDLWVKDRAQEAERRDRNEQPWAGRRA
jgi:Family of unknown function (DUF6498)